MKLAIIGIGGMGRDLFVAAREPAADHFGNSYDAVYFADDRQSLTVLGARVVRIEDIAGDDKYVVGVGSAAVRRSVAERCSHIQAGMVRAPTVVVGPDVEIGKGSVLCDYTTITTDVRIGRHFQANIYCYVAHDCVVGDFVTLAPRVSCNGNVHIEDDVFIGSSAVIRNGAPGEPLVIGRGAVIGMGAVVTRSVPAGATVVGNPARPLEVE